MAGELRGKATVHKLLIKLFGVFAEALQPIVDLEHCKILLCSVLELQLHREVFIADLELERVVFEDLQLAAELSGAFATSSIVGFLFDFVDGLVFVAEIERIVALGKSCLELLELIFAFEVNDIEFAVALLLLHELTEFGRVRIIEVLDIEKLRHPLVVVLHHLELFLDELGVPL